MEADNVKPINKKSIIAPFRNKDIQIGFGAGFPLTDDEEFKYRLIGSIFYHFQHN